ncbi:hypothetical protein ACFL6U_10280 [Planctomycetota bacterium]
MREIGFALLFGFGGIFAAALYTYIIGIAGAPGAILTTAATKRSPDGITPVWGLFLTVAGQLYASLVFVTLVINFVDARISDAAGFGKWIAWFVAFFVAIAPPAIALKDAARAEQRNVQHHATTFLLPLTVIGFILFKWVPTIMMSVCGWVPQF